MKKCMIGGILRHNGGFGFKVTFDDVETTKYYKDMIFWIIKNDNFSMDVKNGYYEKEK
jgi:hypothetical protein